MSRPPGRRLSRAARLGFAFVVGTSAVGVGATLFALLRADPSLHPPSLAVLAAGVPVAIATVGNLLLRFARWQYLLRRLEVRRPTVSSLGSYVGSFALLPVPLYLGQLVARERLAEPLAADERPRPVLAFVWEHALDVWVLALLAAGDLSRPLALALLAAPLVGVVRRGMLRACRLVATRIARLVLATPVRLEAASLDQLASPRVFAVAALLSVGAWGVTALSVVPLAWAAGLDVGGLAAARAAAGATLLGALSLSPLGVGVSGMLLIGRLQALGASALGAAQVAFVHRVASAWLSVALGGCALVALRSRRRRSGTGDHFDDIDECYDAWVPAHYREHLVARKMAPVLARLETLGPRARGLDIGCGRGWYARRLARAGAHMVGIDPSAQQLAAAGEYVDGAVPLLRASVLGLPFRSAAFDFAYIINVIHHMPTRHHQGVAFAEIAAVIRPGGLLFVHEMNVINPLFRLYLGYVFPLLKGIDEGTEYFLDPRTMGTVPGFRLADVGYFTFIPDFVPVGLLPALAALERRLERSRLAPYAAHFVAVYERTAERPAPLA